MKKALLIDAIIDGNDTSESIKEMENLLNGLDIELAYTAYQVLDMPKQATYIGKGKLQEIKDFIENKDFQVDLVVCNFDLKLLQYKNIQEFLDIEVLDRTNVILQIFAMQAKTKEAKLQVEMASLEYLKTRLIDKSDKLSQITSSGGGLSNRGSGEKQIDIDRYNVRRLLKKKKDELDALVKQREQNRKMRYNYPLVAVVGYTNAGKSSLVNRLLEYSKAPKDKKVLEENRLFATLQTSTRLLETNEYPDFLITDTVGFIDNLPTTLVKAFRSTLEEIKEADLLVHVVDVSDANYRQKMEVTWETLKEIGVNDIPEITLFNKCDMLKSFPFIPNSKSLFTSLNNQNDCLTILKLISETLAKSWEQVEFDIGFENNIFEIKKHGYITDIKITEDGYHVIGSFPKSYLQQLKLL